MMATIETVNTEHAPAAVGPYSQAAVYNGIVYTSGQVGLDPSLGRLVADDVSSQALQVMKNLDAVLKACDSDKSQIIKVNIFLDNMADFPTVNALYAEWLGEHRPARATVEVAGLPLAAKIEIDVVACQ
ncbi:MAG: Rid family detoxifying hydrolase [Mariprofundaceae bacterium]|nr:Rid family detoxifying hydrolase [Mariprofundaceae bacterium]